VILVDSSVWVDHFRSGDRGLAAALDSDQVLAHPLVIGELACGNIGNRREILALLLKLPSAPLATHAEALAFLEAHAVMGRGIGFIDVHLLASTALATSTSLWTREKRLGAVATELNLAYEEAR
jgi:predicted nucleic acid-binding protein